MRHIIILGHILLLPLLGYSQICGLSDTIIIASETSLDIPIVINPGDLANENLADPNQGICGIELIFRHQYVTQLGLTLISPSGQSVQLTGPTTLSVPHPPTFGARWRVTFVANAITAQPDANFTPRWNNSLNLANFVLGGLYQGSYYPYTGNLEDFNTGNTYGSWILRVNNNLSLNAGAILGIRLIFCDGTGLDCCFADAGNLQDNDLLTCEGNDTLQFVPNIAYSVPRPDPDLYGYTYLVSRDSILLGYDSTGVNLNGFAAGIYQVCGLAYLRADSLLLPQPDGQYTLGTLYADLNGLNPSFCADLTGDCQEIIILAPPDPENLLAQICEGESYTYRDSTYTESGSYPYLLKTASGCDSVVNIVLSIIPTRTVRIDSTICNGEQVQIGTSIYNSSGTYQDTLLSSIGCDSIIILDLEVVADITTTLNEVICEGDSLIVGNQIFFNSINTQIVLPSSRNCDSIINLNLTVLNPIINLDPIDTITCASPSVLLNAGNSVPIGLVNFEWQDAGGSTLGVGASLNVDQPGDYLLLVTQEAFGAGCTVQQTVTVPGNESFPTADAGLPQMLNCTIPELTLGGNATSIGNNFIYAWTTDSGNFLDATDIPAPRVNAPGRYTFVVTNTSNNCSDTTFVDITADQNTPVVRLLPDTSLTCSNPTILLTSVGSSQGNNFVYEWRDGNGISLGTDESLSVDSGGNYELLILNTVNNCRDSAQVNVVVDTLSPVFSIAPPPALTCEESSIRLNATAIALDPDVNITWQALNGGALTADANTLSPLIDAAGTYSLLLSNARNGCQSTASVVVSDNSNIQSAQPSIPDVLTCSVSVVSLDSGTSSSGPNVIYQWTTTNGQFVGNSIGQSVQVNRPGTYTLTVLDTVSRCSDVATVNVQRDLDSPIAEAGTGFTINCDVRQDTLFGTGSSTGPAFSYRWNGPCLRSDPDSLWVLVDCPGIYYLEVINTTNNCVVQDSVEVLLDQQVPVAAVLPVDTLNCVRPQVVLDATASAPSANLSYNWSGPDIAGTASGASLAVSVPGDYQLIITDTLRFCRDTLLITVPIDTLQPIADAGPEVLLTCEDPVVQIGGPNTSTGPFFSHVWLAVEGQLPGAGNAPMVPADGAGIFRLIVTDTRNGCRDSSTVVVIEDQELPGAHAGFDQELTCGTDLINLDGTNSVQQAEISYQWSGPCLLGRTDSIGAQANCPGDYILTVTNTLTGCSAADTVAITLNPAAPRSVLPDTAIIDCATGGTVLDGSASSNGFFEWMKDGVLISNGLESITVDDIGLYVLSVSNQDKSCIALDSIVVVSDCQPQIDITPPERITCQRPTVMIDAGNSTGQSLVYEWIAPDPACMVSGQGTPFLEVSCGGTYTLILTNSSVLLSDTQTVVVDMDATIPLAIVGPPDTLTCVQDQVLLDGAASSSGPNIVYQWTRVSNGAIIAQTPTAITDQPGTFILEVADTVSLCTATATVRIVEFNLPISLSFGDSLIPCGQDTFALTAFPDPLSDFYSYQWSGPNIVTPADSASVRIVGIGTYTLSVVDSRSACRATASVRVSEDQQCAPCVAIVQPDTLTCAQSSLVLQADFCRPCTGCVLQWTTPDGRIIANGNTLQPTIDQAGTYQLTVIDQQGFQTDVAVEVVADNSLPAAMAGPDRLLTCDSSAVTLGMVSSTAPDHWVYAWTTVDNPIFTPSSQQIITVAASGIYALEVRDTLTGCVSLDTVMVSYDTIVPIANAGVDRTLSCTESFVILDGSGSSGGNGMEYTWTSGNPGNCLQGVNAVNPIVSCVGTYYLQVENSNTGCLSTDSLVVSTSEEVPVLTPLPDTTFTCDRDSIVLMGNLPDPTGYSFTWCTLDVNGQPVPGSCVDNLAVTVTTAGNYQFSVTDDGSGCQASFTVEVDDPRELPEIDAGIDLTFSCTDDSLSWQAAAGPDPRLLDIQWISLGNFPINNANSLTPVVYAADTLLLVVTNRQTSCAVQDTVIIRQDINAPTVDAGPDTLLTCLQTTLRLQGTGSSAGGSPLSYQWSTLDGNIQANAGTAMPSINRPGTYVLTVTDEGNACTATDVVEVGDARQAPIAAIAGLDSLQFSCDVDSLFLDATVSTAADGGALDYLWSVVSTGNLIGDPTQSTIMTNSIGTYRLIVTDRQSGCQDSLQFTLNAAFGAPVIRIVAPAALTCTREEVALNAIASEFGNGYTATWYNEQGDILLTDSLVLTVAEAGAYTLQIDNNNSGCSSISNPVVVRLDTLTPLVAIAPPGLLDCTINSVRLDGSASSAGAGFQYQWTTVDGILLDAANQAFASVGGPGLYQLQVTNTQNGCLAIDTIRVEAITTPIASIQVEIISPTCTNEAGGAIIVQDVIGGTPPFTYSLNNGVDLNTGSFTQLRAGTYTLTIRDANGCEWEEERIIPGVTPVDVDLGSDMLIQSGDSIRLVAQTNTDDIVSYHWEPAIGTGPDPVIMPEVTTSYGLTVTDGNGCTATDRILVQVEKRRAYFLPTAFSPDGDGNNDYFMVMTGPEVINIPSFRIYDRWGHLVYERLDIPPNDPNLGWDGRHNGQSMNPAVFVYFIELEYNDGWVEAVKGDVTLLW